MKHPLLYELNTRCWLAELSGKAGRPVTLAEVPGVEFDFWQRCGFTHLWLMGVWTLGPRGRAHSRKCFEGRRDGFGCRADIEGSPYAIAGYTVSRRLGGAGALARFRHELNQRGIRLVLDFVPNHTALDHAWVKAHPEFYVASDARRAGTIKPHRGATKWFAHGHCGHGAPWVDTLQLNYGNPDLRRAMIDELIGIAGLCDGVRCDMAMLVLNDVFARTWRTFEAPAPTGAAARRARPGAGTTNEFWCDAIGAVRERRSDFLFLAEAYWDCEARLQELGFDCTYDKLLYDRIVARDAPHVTRYLESLAPDFLERSAHFLENHDEPRVASLLSFEEHRAAALLVLALPGLRLLHEGQISGFRTHANIHLAARKAEPPDQRIATFYARLLEALRQGAVGQGQWQLLAPQPAWADNPTHRNFAVLQWQSSPPGFDLAVVNLGGTRSQCRVSPGVEGLTGADWRLTDLLGVEIHERSGAELAQQGLYLDLPSHGAQLFHCERIQK